MAFPVSVADVWKMFEWANRRKAENKEAVCQWLDAVYSDLEDLSKVWGRICESLETANEKREIDKALAVIKRGDPVYSQSIFAGRLLAFYLSASLVLGHRRTADFHRDFVTKLGTLLRERRTVRQMLDKELSRQSMAVDGKLAETLGKMREQVEAINEEVVSLQVMIRTFKAQP